MQIYDVIASAQSGHAIANLARAANVEPQQMDAAVRSVVADLTLSLERNTLSRGGLADLVKALGDGHHEYILDNPSAMADPRVTQDGAEILDHILGSKDKSRGIAMRASQASGLSDGLIKMLLPYLAQMLMGAIAKWAKGGLGDVLGKLPGGGSGGGLPLPMPQGGRPSGGGGGFELPRSDMPQQGGYPMPPIPDQGGRGYPSPSPGDDNGRGGGGFQIPWPQSGGTGNGQGGGLPFPFPFPLPQGGGGSGDNGGFQIPWPRQPTQPRGSGGTGGGGGFELPKAEMPPGGYPMPPIPGGSPDGRSGSFPMPPPQGQPGGGNPLPLPGPHDDNPYGDLSDILRRGGGVAGSGPLGSIVRNVLGGLLGFGGRGIIGWMIRLLVMRFGWSFLKRMLGRMLTGR